MRKTKLSLGDIDGVKIRRQYFDDICAIFLLMMAALGVAMSLMGIPFSMKDVMTAAITILLILLPLLVLAVLNHLYFGRVICVLNAEGIHYEGGVIPWETVKAMDYSTGGKRTPCRMKVFCERETVVIRHVPFYLYLRAKKYKPEIKMRWTNFLLDIGIALVIAVGMALMENP